MYAVNLTFFRTFWQGFNLKNFCALFVIYPTLRDIID